MTEARKNAKLILEDGGSIVGESFGFEGFTAGEVVFNTGMVGYPESLTDPSYRGQILVLTYPLVGNYGIPAETRKNGLLVNFESENIQAAGLVVSGYSESFSHYQAEENLGRWLKRKKIPALTGIDTRALTEKLRSTGTMLGKIEFSKRGNFFDPGAKNLLPDVSVKKVTRYGSGKLRILCLDCGIKNTIIRELLDRGVEVLRVPWDYPMASGRLHHHGVLISNGPGDPQRAGEAIRNIRVLLTGKMPIFGICLGTQLLALASGAKTYKLKFGHRGQNQPCQDTETGKCYITSQNHGYAVSASSLVSGFKPWFLNLNDQTVEGIKHSSKPFFAVQFHPEAAPGPSDSAYLFDLFLSNVQRYAKKS